MDGITERNVYTKLHKETIKQIQPLLQSLPQGISFLFCYVFTLLVYLLFSLSAAYSPCPTVCFKYAHVASACSYCHLMSRAANLKTDLSVASRSNGSSKLTSVCSNCRGGGKKQKKQTPPPPKKNKQTNTPPPPHTHTPDSQMGMEESQKTWKWGEPRAMNAPWSWRLFLNLRYEKPHFLALYPVSNSHSQNTLFYALRLAHRGLNQA